MQQKKQDIVVEAHYIIRNYENRNRKKRRHARLRFSRVVPFLYGAIGFICALFLSFVLRVSLFR